MNNIAEQLKLAYQNIKQKCLQLQISNKTVQLIAVSKTKPAADILTAYTGGQRRFAENYPQELADKQQQLADKTDIEWHFIGPLQSNKTKLVAQSAAWVHSIDRLKIAKRLAEQRPNSLGKLKVLIQLNICNENSKSGIAPESLLEFAAQINTLPQLELKGLMAIPALGDSEQAFAAMQQHSLQLQQHYPHAKELSMGMSADWQIALRYGATMIRLGTAIFGKRDTNEE
ncbi:YggS family pyridoxal phosphate-dependent enzyme [Rheinheimera sp. MMS21-TC3]|uniref:YggS family pyridoxal phosphate-dependent enzyme n=1 Tax=Rheinheimera sp. MMS21-TC3 TaxID=3072790 RepID=UPI0028C3F164|nr:YggS family pyridoxal phosphate-dependent enzyme [Rheinheimera sp. MMS21-TC3]WNO61384.1 YggS family pyridoxal phosphate-dependent enzyme [Rheinheimera sp. MMS21-TC3]